VEFRHYNPGATGDPDHHVWPLRNYMWAKAGPLFCSQAEANIADKTVRYKVIDGFGALWRFNLENLIRSDNTVATDQIISYPPVSDASRYTFSLWAFPEETYPTVLPAYFAFCKQYYQDAGYRNNMLYVGYRILQDRQALLSYSWDGNVMTIDPVSTANPGWTTFLAAYNQWCSDHGGIPLPNQTPLVTRAQLEKALGGRWTQFAAARRTFDPNNRLLNAYFRDLLGE
jgi:FAD/FMN-containing dehydrogenase